MKHVKADFSKLELVDCLYHRTYMTFPDATLEVTVNGVKQQYRIRKRAANRDKLYHSKGLKAVLVVYDGIVLAYEILKEGLRNTDVNLANLQTMMRDEQDDWYFDNERFYQLNAKPSNTFISIQCINVIDPLHLTYSSTIEVISNDCFAITHEGQLLLQTPPISTKLKEKNKKFLLLDQEQDLMYISLTALLKICNTATKLYGGDVIEEFDIPQYMIRHKTVNLSKMPPYVRDNSTTALKPYEAIAYLLGLIYKETDNANTLKLLKVLRNICSFGVINITSTLKENVFKDKKLEIRKIDLQSILNQTEENTALMEHNDLEFELTDDHTDEHSDEE